MRLSPIRTAVLLLACLGLMAPVHAQDAPHVFRNAILYPISADPIDPGVMVVQNGTIQAVGEAGTVDVPASAEEHDLAGKTVMPGLVDTHSHIGQVSGGDGSAAMHPDARTIDAINVRHPSMNRARAGGITTVQVLSGSGHLLSGQTAYLKLREGGTIDELSACDDRGIKDCGGMKMANGTNPQREDGPFPGTRARAAAMWPAASSCRRRNTGARRKTPSRRTRRRTAICAWRAS